MANWWMPVGEMALMGWMLAVNKALMVMGECVYILKQ